MSRLVLKPKEDHRVRAGHLWIFSNEVARVPEDTANGSVVDVVSDDVRFLGRAYYNRHSLIAARLLSRRREEIDLGFFVRRLRRAKAWREELYGATRSCRMVYSEGDLLPGLIVDSYDGILVMQLLTLGMEHLRPLVIEALQEVFAPRGLVVRNDSAFRGLEGLPSGPDEFSGEVPDRVIIEEGGARFEVDLKGGQKTGFYFDQRENRTTVGRLASRRRVLDCFSYTGGFAIHCARGGATHVLAVDDSAPALDGLTENVRLNSLEGRVDTVRGNAFEVLRDLDGKKERFDLVILDPPAFVKKKSQLKAGLAGYRDINRAGMKLLNQGGFLVTCSCSQNLHFEDFHNVLRQAARSVGRRFRILHSLTQAPDHPILQAMPETQYLKCVVLKSL
jgi:23S rRNA (cytosine1962-C5)-methyltransferase